MGQPIKNVYSHIRVRPAVERVRPDAIVRVHRQHRLIVRPESQRIHAHSVPAVVNRPIQIAQVKLSLDAAGHETRAVPIERRTRQTVLGRVRHLQRRLVLLHVPDEQIGAVLRAADQQVLGVRRPGDERHAVRVPLQRAAQLHRAADRIHVPDDDGGVLGAGGQLQAVGREAAVPHLVAVVGQHLQRLDGELLVLGGEQSGKY